MASKSSEVVILENEELEDGEIEDDIEEFNEYESLFQSSDNSTESRLSKVANKHNIRREKERTSVRNKSHSSRIGHRHEKSKSPSAPKSHGGLPGRRRTSPVPSKRSHRRRTSSADIAKGLRQKAETRLRRRRRGESPPKPTMRYLLHQRHPTITSSHPKKKRRESDMEQYEHLLLKHRELQEAIEMEKSILIRSSGPDVIEIETRSNRKKTSRSRSRSGSQKDALEKVERKQLHVDKAALAIQEDADDSDEEMDELQLRMIALQSATRAVAAREEKENKEELLLEMEKENASISPPAGSSRARQEERKQKLAKWKKQHSLTVEINKASDEKSRYQLFMDHMARGTKPQDMKQNGQQSTTQQSGANSRVTNDSDSDIIEIPPPGVDVTNNIIAMQEDNYEPVEMEVDNEDSGLTPLFPVVSDTSMSDSFPTFSQSQPPPPGISPVKSLPPTLPQPTQPQLDDDKAKDEEEDDEEEIVALRQLLLQSMQAKKAAKMKKEKEVATKVQNTQPPVLQSASVSSSKGQGSAASSGTTSPVISIALKQLRQAATAAKAKPPAKPQIPVHKPVIIRPGDDSDDSDDDRYISKETSSQPSMMGLSNLDMFLKQARKSASKTKTSASSTSDTKDPTREPTTPEAMSKLPDVHQAEYQRLKQEIVRREQKKQTLSTGAGTGSGTASPDPYNVGSHLPKNMQVTIKSGSRSATASPDRSENQSVRTSKDASVSEPESCPTFDAELQKKKDLVAKKAKLQREALLKEEARKREIRTCKEKMLKHRQAIEKGHKLLHNLDFQVDKKSKVVNLMQIRVKKLKQELLAANKMVGVHQGQVQKFLEQKQQVRNRLQKHVTEETQLRQKLAVALGEPLSDTPQPAIMASLVTSANGTASAVGAKRPLEPSTSSVNKKSKVKVATSSPSKSKSDDKLQELQKLERAYAQKIEQLKMDQAKKAQNKMLGLSLAASRLMKSRKTLPNVKPAKQVYLIDKITLGGASSGNSSGEEGPSKSKRRKSWLDGHNSYLRPNLAESSNGALSQKLSLLSKLTKPSSPAKKLQRRTSMDAKHALSPSKDAKKQDKNSIAPPPEPIVDGLFMPNVAQLKLLQQIQAEKSQKGIDFVTLSHCFDTFQREATDEDGFDVKSAVRIGEDADEEMVSLETYTSSLAPFKAYRLNPNFEAGAHMTRHSMTVSNKIHHMVPFCKYELNGKCNDEECQWQHERDYLLKELELYEDLSSYMQLKTPPESKSSNAEKINKEFDKMMKLVEKAKDSGRIDVEKRKMEMGKVCVERVRKHFQNKGISVLLEPRNRPKPYLKSASRGEYPDKNLMPRAPRRQLICKPDALCLDDTERYFFKTSEGVVDLEAAVLERPNDVDLWLKLAYKQLAEDSTEKNLDKALHALSRGLESNKNSSVVWLHYLNLYEQRDKHPDLLQLCQQAVDFAPDYEIWWKYLMLKPSFTEKDTECQKLLEFIQEQQKENKTAIGSHRLLEVLLYRVQLYITTRRVSQGLTIFQDALREYSVTSLCRHLLPKDRCLAWMAYLHAMGFHCLPPSLFDPATGALGRLVCKDPFMFPWNQADSSRLSEPLIAGFQDALLSCSSSQLPIEDSIEICLPIYQNLFNMEAKLDRLNKAQIVCRHLLHDCPSSSQLWLCLIDIEKKNNSGVENIAKVFKEALASCPTSAELYYNAAKFELEHDNKDEGLQYLKQCVTGYFDLGSNEGEVNMQDMINLYRSLLNQHLPYNYKPPSLADGITPEIIEQNLLYLWSCYCLYLEKLQTHEAVAESFETGLCALKNTKDVQKLWLMYLDYQKSLLSSTGDNALQSWKVFSDLVYRCLISMATVWPLPYSSNDTWVDFSFHNRVLELYIGCVRKENTGDAYELFLNRMPGNISLAFRACQHAIGVGNEFQAQLIARAVLSDYPTCVSFWKMRIRCTSEQWKPALCRHLCGKT